MTKYKFFLTVTIIMSAIVTLCYLNQFEKNTLAQPLTGCPAQVADVAG